MASRHAANHAETAEAQIAALRTALRQTWLNIGLLSLLLLAFVAGIVYAAFFGEGALKRKEDQFVTDVRQRVQEDTGWLTDEAVDLVAAVAPPVVEAFRDRFQADMPVYMETIDRQGKEMAEHLQATLEKEVRAEYQDSLSRYRKVLQEEFPEVTDRETLDRMMAHFKTALDDLIQRYYLDEFRNTLDETARLWKQIPPAPSPKAGEKALVDQLGNDLADWLRMKAVEADVRGARTAADAEARWLEQEASKAAGKEKQR
jgi:hypothetical protein